MSILKANKDDAVLLVLEGTIIDKTTRRGTFYPFVVRLSDGTTIRVRADQIKAVAQPDRATYTPA